MKGGLLVWLGIAPVRLEDKVTGERYMFLLEGEAREILTVKMLPGTSQEGERFMLTIDSIGPPEPKHTGVSHGEGR
ncbi:MAG: hypothetical protein JSU86_11825 [Phycisphaerales bacterium]|nr:MAG: hypothetical protein JSU86_11825 [Phycisphaerales bacterium]